MDTLTDNAYEILKQRYLLKNNNGSIIEEPDELFYRVAKFVASAETKEKQYWESRFYDLMSHLEFLPNSPTLMNAGCLNGQLSACFVLPIEDSLDSIFTTLKNAALIHQSGGGTGFNFSKLRPKNDVVNSICGTSSGPVAFMKIYDAATEYVKQGGRRRGANMGILNIDHPDIEEFIHSKSNKKAITNFNISVGITDDFINALQKNQDWQLKNPRTKKVYKLVSAKKLWENIVYEAWKTGDPGLIFLDTINKFNPTPLLGEILATNPCGEVPLLDYESCNLGSINLSKMLIAKGTVNEIDWNKLKDTVHNSIRFLDNIISLNHYILPKIEIATKATRKIGLGVMGWAELLMLLEIPYASEKALFLAEKLMQFIQTESYKASESLAQEKGAYPQLKHSMLKTKKRRNAACNSIAPPGTISVIADTSYSIEPLFALAYKRVGILGNKTQIEINKTFIKKMRQMGYWNEHVEHTILETGSIDSLSNIPKNIKSIFQTSLEIPWQYHLKHQIAFQRFTDNAVSKTINLPETASVKDIVSIYETAWKSKLKGITIYRYGSKDNQVLLKCSLNNSYNC